MHSRNYQTLIDSIYSESNSERFPTLQGEYHTGITDFLCGYFQGLGFTALDVDGDPLFPCVGEFSDHWEILDELWDRLPESRILELVDSIEGFLKSVQDASTREIDYLAELLNRPKEAGTDFHYTRNGHGAGFWDGDWKENNVGDVVTPLCKLVGGCELTAYLNDDGETVFDFDDC